MFEIEIGDIFQGGVVFYIDKSGRHGLIAAHQNLEKVPWGCNNQRLTPQIGSSGFYDNDLIGTGLQNTLNIVSKCSERPTAASEALEYEFGGYSDWYLPSHKELCELLKIVNESGYYWSSSEGSVYGVKCVLVNTTGHIWVHELESKSFFNKYNVRPIRSF